MMRQGNFGSPIGNYRGGQPQGNFGRNQGGGANFNRNQGNFGGRYQNQRGGYNNRGRQNQNQNQGNRVQDKSPARNDAKKPNNTPTKANKPEDIKQDKPETPKQEVKTTTQSTPPAQSPAKKDATTPAAQKPANSTTPVKKDEAPKPAGNNTSTKKDIPVPQPPKQPPQKQQQQQQQPKQQQSPQQQKQQQQPPPQQYQKQQQQSPQQYQRPQQQKPQTNTTQDKPSHFQKQDRSQNESQNQRQDFQKQDRSQNESQNQRQDFQKPDRPNYNQRQKQGSYKPNRERDSSFSKGDSYMDLSQGPKEEKKFTGRCRLFVGNLTPDVTEDDFKNMFEQYGEVSEAYVNSGRGFGFIRMDYRHNAEAAKAALDGLQRKGRTLRIRFATHGAALKVRNIHPFASNELLENAFAQFGDLERAIVIVDDRGKPTGEGIVEFVRKPGAQQALRRINDGIFLLGSSPRPLVVEPLEQTDEDDGMPEKFVNKNEGYKKERDKEPRFALPGSFEFEFAQRWRQIDEMEKERIDRVKKDMEDARLRLDDEMQGALIEYQADQIRKDLMRQQEELRRLEEMRQQDQMRRRQDMEIRQREEERMRAEDERRLQEMMMGGRHGPMDQGGPRGRDNMMGGLRDGPGPRGMKDGAPPLPPPPAPPAGMGLDRSGRPNQMQGGMSGNFSNSPGMGGGMGNTGGMGAGGGSGGNMPRQSRFDQQGGNFDGGFQSGGGMGGSMGGNMGGGQGGPGNMFGNQGMGGESNMGSGSGQGMRGGDRMDRRREGGPRDDYGDVKRRRY